MTDEPPEDLAARRRNTAISLLEDAKDEAILGTFTEIVIIGFKPDGTYTAIASPSLDRDRFRRTLVHEAEVASALPEVGK